MELSGIAAFIHAHAKCKSCGHAMSMQVSQRGRAYLKCPACQENGFIELDFLRWYIQKERIVCPTHRCAVEAKLGQYGLYVKCEHGHTIKVQESPPAPLLQAVFRVSVSNTLFQFSKPFPYKDIAATHNQNSVAKKQTCFLMYQICRIDWHLFLL